MALRNGARFAVSLHDVFSHGCHLVPGSITEAQAQLGRVRLPCVDSGYADGRSSSL